MRFVELQQTAEAFLCVQSIKFIEQFDREMAFGTSIGSDSGGGLLTGFQCTDGAIAWEVG